MLLSFYIPSTLAPEILSAISRMPALLTPTPSSDSEREAETREVALPYPTPIL